jgi:hypothetical protein
VSVPDSQGAPQAHLLVVLELFVINAFDEQHSYDI